MTEYRFTKAFPYLLTRVGVRMGEIFAQELAEAGLTLHMYRVLAALWERDDQRLVDLAEMVSSEVSTLSRLVGTLLRMRYLTRKRMETDGRTVRISLTPAGRAVAETWVPRAMYYEATATKGFSDAEVADLKEKLERVFHNLQDLESVKRVPSQQAADPEKSTRRSRQPLRAAGARRRSVKAK